VVRKAYIAYNENLTRRAMFNKTPVDDNHQLNEVIDDALVYMHDYPIDSEDYDKILTRLERLTNLRQKPAERNVSPDTMAMIVGNLIGIMMIVGHERAHVVTSRALMFIKQLR
jgi:hypothetical protein